MLTFGFEFYSVRVVCDKRREKNKGKMIRILYVEFEILGLNSTIVSFFFHFIFLVSVNFCSYEFFYF